MLTRPRQRQNGARHIPCSNTERTAKSGDGCLKAGQIDPAEDSRAGATRPMQHAASRELYAYWNEKRGTRPAPERAEIDPGAIRGVLSDTFILALDRSADHPIRLAGTRVCALFDREIKGEAFLKLWSAASRPIVRSLMTILADECTGTVAGVTAKNADGEFDRSRVAIVAARHKATELCAGNRRPGSAQSSIMAGCKSDQCADARRPPPCRSGTREAIAAALYDATDASGSDGL